MRKGRDTSLSWLLGKVCHLHHKRIRMLMEGLGLYRGQPPMLDALWQEDGRSHTELAKALRVQPATVSKMVQRMERSGFVTRRADLTDQRVSRVFLTDEGRRIKRQVDERFDQLERETLGSLSIEERHLLWHLLTRVAADLQDVVAKDA